MASIVFDPAAIDAASAAASNASVVASNASVAAGSASSAASVAQGTANSASSDIDVVEADDRYARSIYSKPATGSFAIFKMDITSDSKVYISHSDTAAG